MIASGIHATCSEEGQAMSKRKSKTRGRPRLTRASQAERDVETFLASQQTDDAADYASRGRVFKPLTDKQLAEKWVSTFRDMADAPGDQALRALETDLRSEFRLRNIEPPHDQIKSEMDRFVAHLSSWFEKLERDDPDRVTEMNEEMEQDIADLKARMKRSN
jgi:hypothetical protein